MVAEKLYKRCARIDTVRVALESETHVAIGDAASSSHQARSCAKEAHGCLSAAYSRDGSVCTLLFA